MSLLQNNLKYLREQLGVRIPSDVSISNLESILVETPFSLLDLLTTNMNASSLAWDKIRFVFLDVDGVLTEGGMFYTESGDEFKRFDTKDGMAIKTAMKSGIQFGIISSGINEKIIRHRAEMFGIEHVYVGTEAKIQIAEKWLQNLGISWDETGYIGDDINDLAMFKHCGIAACPSDASIPNKKAAHLILSAIGGHGCVREYMRNFPQFKDQL